MDSLDPIMNFDSRVAQLSIFESLTQVMADGSLAPQLAESWTSNADATEWIFKIRTDSRWSDGSPVTRDDIVFTFITIMNSSTSPNRTYLTTVKSVDKVGDDGVRFRLSQPFASWPREVTLIPIAPAASYQAMGSEFGVSPIGSGPYRVTAFERGGRLEMAANKTYWGGAPEIDRVIVDQVPDSVARFNGLQSGDLDVTVLTPQQVPLARTLKGVAVSTAPSNKVVYLGFNTTTAPLGNETLRHAMDYAIDREAISKFLLRGLAQPIGQLVSRVTFGYDPAIAPTLYDPARAKALLKESGYQGEPITFEYPTDGTIPLTSQVAQAVEGYLESAGFNIRMHGVDQHALIADWVGRNITGMYMFAYNPSTIDAALVTGDLFGPKGVKYFADPEIERLEALQKAQAEPGARQATLGGLWRLSAARAYYLPLFNTTTTFASVVSMVRYAGRADGYILAQELRRPETRVAD